MAAAADAMGKAVGSLDALKTADALPPEMEALNHLLKAQADVKKPRGARGSRRAAAAATTAATTTCRRCSTRSCRRQQQTNYETKVERRGARAIANQSALDKIKDLARRQDELLEEAAGAREEARRR